MYAPFQTKLVWKPDTKGQHLSVWSFEMNTHPSPRAFLPYFYQSVHDFFVQKYLAEYQLLWRSLQILHYLANKENKVPIEEQSKTSHTPPKHLRLHLEMNGRNLPPTLALVDKTRLAMKLVSLFVIYFCSLFCLLVGLHRAQNTRNIEMQQLMNN